MALQHTRSHSFPCASQPAIIRVDESLLSEPTTSSFSSVANRMKGLENLYESIDDLLLLPNIQRIIANECQEKCVDQILEWYIMLLDACAAARDLISLAKRDAHELLSGMRRRTHADAASTYLTSRRKLRKIVQKSLKEASAIRKKQHFQVVEKGYETRPVENLLMDANSAALGMLNSIFSYMVGAKVMPSHSRRRSWVSKLVDSKKVSCEDEETEFTKVDAAMISFMQSKRRNGDDVKVDDLLNYLKQMESNIHVLEDGLECLFRLLIKTRVLLLNIPSH